MEKLKMFINKFEDLNKLIIKKNGKKYKGNELDLFSQFQLKKHYEKYFSMQKIYTLIKSNDILVASSFLELNKNLFDDLEKIHNEVKHEITVIENCVLEKDFISMDIKDKVVDGIKIMKDNNINSLLIKDSNKYIGLFRNKTIVEYYEKHKELVFDNTVKFSEFKELLLFDNLTNIQFIKPNLTLEKLYNINRHNFNYGERISFYFITKDGKNCPELLGLITPYRISTFLI